MSQPGFIAVDYLDCRDEYISFRNANREAARDEAYFEWRFLRKPGGCPPLVVWCLAPSGEKIGAVGFTRDVYSVDGAEAAFGQLCDISISKAHRGMGIANRMLDFLAAQPAFREKPLSFAMPNRDATRALGKAGWTTLASLERHVKILRADTRIKKALGENAASAALSTLVNAGLRAAPGGLFFRTPPGLKAGPAGGFDRSFDELWARYDRRGAVMGLRTSEYLSWRYADHPLVEYKTYALFEGSALAGYIVYSQDGEHCHIDDMLALDPESARVLLSSFIGFKREDEGTATVVVKTNESRVFPLPLGKLGFVKRADSQGFMTRTTDAAGGLLTDPSRWYLTPGDKDA